MLCIYLGNNNGKCNERNEETLIIKIYLLKTDAQELTLKELPHFFSKYALL